MFPEPKFRTRVVTDFYPRALELRERFNAFFATPYNTTRDNFVLNYWHVPDLYLYMRAHLGDIVGHAAANTFMEHLNDYAKKEFGLSATQPYLSIYVNGMYQSIHSDQRNGTYGYVYSITNWATRTFVGGETMIAREGVFDQLEPREHRGRDSYMTAFPPVFNQLLLFDDRVAHSVNPIMGGMDPTQGRIVIHGHVY